MQSTPPVSPTPPTPPGAPPKDPSAKFQNTPIFMAVLNELNVNTDQLQKRQKLITEIETALNAKYGGANRVMSYVLRFGHARTLMHTPDIPNIETVLNSITGAEQINLLLHSPGGDGTIVEKMVDMCRTHISGQNRKFRVIVPNVAKSAATALALGADQILMGYCSELGPIDPQVVIAVSGITQWVSAFAFVDARDKLMDEIAKATKKKEPTVGLLTQLGSLNIPFTNEMEKQIEFARKTAVTLLNKYMLTAKHPSPTKRAKKANDIAKKLLSKQLFPAHGQYIDGNTAKQLGLEVEVLDKDDALWKLIWDYYIRCEVQMNLPLQAGLIKTKLFESANQVSLVVQDTP
jgi:ClpP class serine protease